MAEKLSVDAENLSVFGLVLLVRHDRFARERLSVNYLSLNESLCEKPKEKLDQVERENSSMNTWTSIVGAYKMVHVLLSQELAEIGLTFPQYRVIRALGRAGAMPMNKIGEHMFVTPANITGLVDRLEGRGYVERKEVGIDRRVVRIGLTRKGESSYRRTSVQHSRLIGKIMGVLSRNELLNLTGQLQKVKDAAIAERNSLRNVDDTAQKSR